MSDLLNRKQFLRASGALMAGSALLPMAGCSSSTGSQTNDSQPPPPGPNYVNSGIELKDVFTGQEIPSGDITFPDGTQIPVRDGLAEVTSGEQLLAGKYRVLIQPKSEGDFVTQSPEIELVDEKVVPRQILPWHHQEFSYQQMKDLFMFGDDSNRYTIRWADGSDITSYHYDESYLDIDTLKFVQSDDPTMLASKFFLEDNIEAYRQVVDWIPDSANIRIQSFIESNQEIDFPRVYDNTTEQAIYNSGQPNTPPGFLLVQGMIANRDNTIKNASLQQKSGIEGAPRFDAPASVYSDSIENFGIRTTGNPRTVVDADSEEIWTPLAPLLIRASYSFAPGSGLYKLDNPLPAKNGTSVSEVEHYIPTVVE